MLLAPEPAPKLFVAGETYLAKLDALSDISQQTFEVDEAFNVEDDEVVLVAHVVKTLLDTRMLFVAKETDAQTFQCGLYIRRVYFFDVEGFAGRLLERPLELGEDIVVAGFVLDGLEDGAGVCFGVLFDVLLLRLLVLLGALVVIEHFNGLEDLAARGALPRGRD
jgi:hypothetical protein